ncbi:Uncharacterised protein [Chlamydia trachomatis]|nr:Uncharacterised protein [Chlamydia trachomatis]
MNAQISIWCRFDDETIYEYPFESSYLAVFANLGNVTYQDTDTLHLSTERSGNILYYSFFKWVEVGVCVGITIGINGYAFSELCGFYTYISSMLNDVWSKMIRIGNGESEEILSNLVGNIRVKLNLSSLFPLSSLPPQDYSISTSYFRGFMFENSELSDILASINKGVTHVEWSITEPKAEKVEGNSKNEAPEANNVADSAKEVRKSSEIKWSTIGWILLMLYISFILIVYISKCSKYSYSKPNPDSSTYSTPERHRGYSNDHEIVDQDDDYDVEYTTDYGSSYDSYDDNEYNSSYGSDYDWSDESDDYYSVDSDDDDSYGYDDY